MFQTHSPESSLTMIERPLPQVPDSNDAGRYRSRLCWSRFVDIRMS